MNRNHLAAAIVVSLSLLPAILTAEPPPHEVRWEHSGELADLQTLEGLSDAMKLNLLPNGERGVELSRTIGGNTEKKVAENCADYGPLVAAGFAPQSGFDIAQDSFFKIRCAALSFLSRATGSKKSFVSGYRFSSRSLNDLPPCVGGIGGDSSYQQSLDTALSLGRSWAFFAPAMKVLVANKHSLVFGDKGERISLDLIAWGDINADGAEDVLVKTATHATEGSFRAFEPFVLTRSRSSGPFSIVKGASAGACDRIAQ